MRVRDSLRTMKLWRMFPSSTSILIGAEERGLPYNVLSLDVRKAFDSVAHDAVIRALCRFRIHESFVNYVLDTLTGDKTTIKVRPSNTRLINIKRGVKQGHPLSPILFNMVLDELLHKLNGQPNIGAPWGTV